MRLLECTSDGDFRLTPFLSDIPPYAILSHTWEREEVTFQDLEHGVGRHKAGYKKIQFCGEQAARDGLRYFWVDTCCIDKSSIAELQEAINCAFRWYQNATKCYVYLSDVSVKDSVGSDIPSQRTWSQDFRISRWFFRGWTLQELIAPENVVFFSTEGKSLGDKYSLEQEIHEITGIPIEALQGRHLGHFSVVKRMSWAKGRETTREEDLAYSLMGIFGINMPILYGEGRRGAIRRLQEEIIKDLTRSETFSQYKDWAEEAGLTHDRQDLEDILRNTPQIPTTNKFKTEIDGIPYTSSDNGTDIDSIFSDGEISASSASAASLNPFQTSDIAEISEALLSQKDLKVLYTAVVRNVERRKARAHIRGFLKEYGRNLLKDASDKSLEGQAAKFVQELAGRIADDIIWGITWFELQPFAAELEKKNLETWLSSLQPPSYGIEEELRTLSLVANIDSASDPDDDDFDEKLDSNLQFPNIDKVKDFLLNSEALITLIIAIRTWLKVEMIHSEDIDTYKPRAPEIQEEPGENIPVNAEDEEVIDGTPVDSDATGPSEQQTEHKEVSGIQGKPDSRDRTGEPESRSILRGSVGDLISGLLNFWGISFYLYDLIELFMPHVKPGHRRLRWRCSVLWGDFPVDDDHALDQLRRELSGWSIHPGQEPSLRGTPMSRPNVGSDISGRGTIQFTVEQRTGPFSALGGVHSSSPQSRTLTTNLDPSVSRATHIVDISFSPKYLELCINIGNYAIDHHEIDISRITSDNELFELIWDKYNLSRGIGLRRLFLRPRNVHFVLFSVSRRTQYGAGIHKKPDEFPPQKELDDKRYHYLCPKIRMPVNVFLHYLHRARWNVWGEHTEDIWLQRLPKKLNESVLKEMRQNAASGQQEEQDSTVDPNLAFGWGVHIIDGPNHAVLGLLLAIGVAVAFFVSGILVGFAKTQEQGFGVGSFLIAVIASIMSAIYFQLQDQ